jgi:hypothetical protein
MTERRSVLLDLTGFGILLRLRNIRLSERLPLAKDKNRRDKKVDTST